jgi:hypothetical protein
VSRSGNSLLFRLATAHKDVCRNPVTHPSHSSIIITSLRGIDLQLLHSRDVGGLDVVLILLNLGLQVVQRDLVILNDDVQLELLNTETNSDQLGATPNKTVLLDSENVLLELFHVCLVIWGYVSTLFW